MPADSPHVTEAHARGGRTLAWATRLVAVSRPALGSALCLLLLLGATAYLHHEALFGGQVYHMDDAADGYYPSHVAILRAYREGHLPTWDRGAWGGWPMAADPYYGPFYPLTVLFAVAGPVRGLALSVAVHVVLGACGAWLLLRRRGLGLGPALLGAAALAFSSFMVVRIRHVIFIELMAWTPLLLAAVEGHVASGRRRELALVGGALGLSLLAGALPLAPFLGLVLLGYLPLRVWGAAGGAGWARARAAAPAALGLALAGGAGLLLGAAQLLPTLAHMPLSARALGADFAFASSYAWPEWRYAATLLLPNLLGDEQRLTWFAQYNHWEMAGYYMGALPLVLAPVGLLRARRRPELIGLFGVGLLGIALAFGDRLPVHGFFFRHLPLYAALRCPTRALVMTLLAWPVLAAEGLAWLEGALARRPPARPLGALLALPASLILGASTWALLHPRVPAPPPELAARGAAAHLLLVVAAAALVVSLARLGRLAAPRAGLLLGALTLGELVIIGRGYVQPKPADFATGTERFAAVEWLLARRPEVPGVQDRFAPEAGGPFRLHNLGLTTGLEGAGGYDSVTVWRWVHLLWIMNHGAPYPHAQLKHDLALGAITAAGFRSPLVDLLNVRWAIATRPPAPGWIPRFVPSPGAAPRARHEPVWDAQLGVYENPHPLPRAFLVHEVLVAKGEDEERALLLRFDPRRQVILERQSPVALAPPAAGGAAGPYTPARVVLAERDRLLIEAEAPAPGVLVVSEAWYPGWRVLVDGAEAPLLRADHALRGVALTAGRHTVEMRYRSRPVALGLGLSAAGLLALAGLALSRGRRGPHP